MGKTLKELDAKPGDVVRFIGHPDLYKVGENEHLIVERSDYFSKGHDLGKYDYWDTADEYEIVSRATPETPDIFSIEKPFGLLDAATQEALQAWHRGGGKVAVFEYWGNFKECDPMWGSNYTYRAVKEPVREKVEREVFVYSDGDVLAHSEPNAIMTYETVEGEIDLETIRFKSKT